MQEKMVTAGNTSYTLEEPFFVLATQNPIEQEGTYPLPEAQLDRFMFNIWVDYPLPHEEEEILRATTGGKRIDPQPVLTQEDVLHLQAVVRKVPVSDHVIKYVTTPRRRDASAERRRTASHQDLRQHRRRPARGAISDSRGQSHGHPRRPHPCQLRRYSPRRPTGFAAPHPDEFRRGFRRFDAAGGGKEAAARSSRARGGSLSCEGLRSQPGTAAAVKLARAAFGFF